MRADGTRRQHAQSHDAVAAIHAPVFPEATLTRHDESCAAGARRPSRLLRIVGHRTHPRSRAARRWADVSLLDHPLNDLAGKILLLVRLHLDLLVDLDAGRLPG